MSSLVLAFFKNSLVNNVRLSESGWLEAKACPRLISNNISNATIRCITSLLFSFIFHSFKIWLDSFRGSIASLWNYLMTLILLGIGKNTSLKLTERAQKHG